MASEDYAKKMCSEIIQRYSRTAIDAKCYCRKTIRDLTKSRLGDKADLRKQHGSMRIKEAIWTRNFLLDNQLGLKLIHHRLQRPSNRKN